jgi:hypothetical protein
MNILNLYLASLDIQLYITMGNVYLADFYKSIVRTPLNRVNLLSLLLSF